MKSVMEVLVGLLWVLGVVVASGFWSTLAAILFPPWGLYLAVEKVATMAGLLK